jgi:microcompartment protein CcmK/EutM
VKLGRVTGTVVSTISHPIYDSRRLLMCDLLAADGEDTGDYLICVDAVGAGAGEVVLILDEGNGARQVVATPEAPIRAVIVGIVDELLVDGAVRDVGGGATAPAS